MRDELAGQVVVIAGASSGIGRATARLLGAQGARVVLAARRAELLHAAAAEVEQAGGEALAVPTDLTDGAQLDRLVSAAIDRFGRIDAWVARSIAGRLLSGQLPTACIQSRKRSLLHLLSRRNSIRSAESS